jgi:hypothetical protein
MNKRIIETLTVVYGIYFVRAIDLEHILPYGTLTAENTDLSRNFILARPAQQRFSFFDFTH